MHSGQNYKNCAPASRAVLMLSLVWELGRPGPVGSEGGCQGHTVSPIRRAAGRRESVTQRALKVLPIYRLDTF